MTEFSAAELRARLIDQIYSNVTLSAMTKDNNTYH